MIIVLWLFVIGGIVMCVVFRGLAATRRRRRAARRPAELAEHLKRARATQSGEAAGSSDAGIRGIVAIRAASAVSFQPQSRPEHH